MFDEQSDLGGTWHPDNTYPNLRTNDVRELYRFSDLPYPDSVGTTLTSEVAAHWLAAAFRGRMDLPDPEAMDEHIARVKDWAAEFLPKEAGGHAIAVYLVDYLDELVRDMGLPTKRLDNWFAEHFRPVHAERYRGLGQELRRARWAEPGSGPAERPARRLPRDRGGAPRGRAPTG